jgi:hypothetical protein
LRVKKHTCCYTSSNLALGSKFARVPARGWLDFSASIYNFAKKDQRAKFEL